MTAPSLAYQDAMNGIAILYDALSNAENELDKLKNPWIKCSDRLPNVMPNIEVEDSHPNLLLCCKLDDGSLSIEQGWYSDLVEEDQPKFFTMWINSEHTSYDFRTDTPEVTHWMPLPELPKD